MYTQDSQWIKEIGSVVCHMKRKYIFDYENGMSLYNKNLSRLYLAGFYYQPEKESHLQLSVSELEYKIVPKYISYTRN